MDKQARTWDVQTFIIIKKKKEPEQILRKAKNNRTETCRLESTDIIVAGKDVLIK